MVDVRGDVLRPPHGTTSAAVKSNKKSEMRSFKSNENIHKKEGGSYYVVSANKTSSVTLQSPGNESQRKHTAILQISNRQNSTKCRTSTRVAVQMRNDPLSFCLMQREKTYK